jgi:hypothetical protein
VYYLPNSIEIGEEISVNILGRLNNTTRSFFGKINNLHNTEKPFLFIGLLISLIAGIGCIAAYADSGLYAVSGQIVFNSNPEPIYGGEISFGSHDGNSGGAVVNNPYGDYSVSSLPNDNYDATLIVVNPSDNSGVTGVPNDFNIQSTNPIFTVDNSDVTQNFAFNTNLVTVTVLDGNGNPISDSSVTVTTNGEAGVMTDANGNSWNASNVESSGNTGSDGAVTLSVFPGLTYSVCADTSSGGQYCTSDITVNSNTTAEVILENAPQPPTELAANSPVWTPVLTWNNELGVTNYNIYRDGINIGSSTSNTYADNTATPGMHTYYATAVNLVGESSPSNIVDVEVESVPTITSSASTSINARDELEFTVTTTGFPSPSLSESGTLPSGITLTDNGDGTAGLSGQAEPSAAGTYPITITATSNAGTASQNFVLTVTDTTEAPTIVSANNLTESYGVPFSFTIDTTGNPVPIITHVSDSGTLPAGVNYVNNKDGTATLSGELDKSSDCGVYTFTVQAKNKYGTVTQVFTLTITKNPVIKTIGTKTAIVGTFFTQTVSATGYTVPSLSANNKQLPNGLNFTDNGNGTGTLAGTPIAGSGSTYTITITATNSQGSATFSFTLNVDEAPSITSANTATATVGQSFNFQVTTTGYPNPNLSKTGTLPKGLTWDASTGTISGTPKAGAEGTYYITITAKNSSGTVTQSFVLIVS